MELWQIVVISVAAAVIVLVAVCAAALIKKFGKSNKNYDKRKDDRTLIEENGRDVASLLALAKGNDELQDELRRLQNKIGYLIPSEDGKIREYDLKIKELIEDLRIRLEKTEPNEPNKKVNARLADLKAAIAERDARI